MIRGIPIWRYGRCTQAADGELKQARSHGAHYTLTIHTKKGDGHFCRLPNYLLNDHVIMLHAYFLESIYFFFSSSGG